MSFRYFVIISPWKKDRALHLNKLESPSQKDSLFQVCLKLAQWFWRRRCFHFIYVFFGGLISWLSTLGKGQGPSFEETWISITIECFVPALVEIGSVLQEKKILKKYVNVFHNYEIISPRKRAGPFIWTKLNSRQPMMHCARFVINWPRGSGEIILNVHFAYLHFIFNLNPSTKS